MIFNTNDFTSTGQKTTPPATIPPGVYNAKIVSEETKPTAKGDGEMLVLIFEVCSGPHTGGRIWERLNLRNPSEKAMEIARTTLVKIYEAANLKKSGDSANLVGKKFNISTFNEQYNGKEYGRIRSFSPYVADADNEKQEEDIDELPF